MDDNMTHIRMVPSHYLCKSRCHFRGQIQWTHPCDTEVRLLQLAPPVCSHKAQNVFKSRTHNM